MEGREIAEIKGQGYRGGKSRNFRVRNGGEVHGICEISGSSEGGGGGRLRKSGVKGWREREIGGIVSTPLLNIAPKIIDYPDSQLTITLQIALLCITE